MHTWMGQCWKSAWYAYLGVPLLIAAAVMTVTSVVVPYWRLGHGREEGLYYFCEGTHCEGLDGNLSSGDLDWLTACQVVYPCAALSAVSAVILACRYARLRVQSRVMGWTLPSAIWASSFIAAILTLFTQLAYSLGAFSDNTGFHFHFAYWFCSASAPALFIGGYFTRYAHYGYGYRSDVVVPMIVAKTKSQCADTAVVSSTEGIFVTNTQRNEKQLITIVSEKSVYNNQKVDPLPIVEDLNL